MMNDLNIQVGDRVTYEFINNNKRITEIVKNDNIDIDWLERHLKNIHIEILKIERIGSNGWYTVYEKKDLLTDEEREFLKVFNKIAREGIIEIKNNNGELMINKKNDCISYVATDKFKNLEKGRWYTLKELRIGERSMRELKAIHQFCKERGWLDE